MIHFLYFFFKVYFSKLFSDFSSVCKVVVTSDLTFNGLEVCSSMSALLQSKRPDWNACQFLTAILQMHLSVNSEICSGVSEADLKCFWIHLKAFCIRPLGIIPAELEQNVCDMISLQFSIAFWQWTFPDLYLICGWPEGIFTLDYLWSTMIRSRKNNKDAVLILFFFF